MTTIAASSGYPSVVTVRSEAGSSTEAASPDIFGGQNIPRAGSQVTRSDIESSGGPRIENATLARRVGLERGNKIKEKTNLKVRGILLSFFGEEAKVAFNVGGEPLEYWLPAKLLSKNGVTAENQPFELLERERQVGDGFQFYTTIVALARASSSKLQPLPLNKAYKAKLKFILKSPS